MKRPNEVREWNSQARRLGALRPALLHFLLTQSATREGPNSTGSNVNRAMLKPRVGKPPQKKGDRGGRPGKLQC